MTSLRIIDGGEHAEPWHQLPNEDETEFAMFAAWLQRPTPRTAPTVGQIAMANQWLERANAYDASRSLPATPRGQLERMLSDAMTIGALEMRKVAKKVKADGDESTIDFKSLITLMHALVENKEQLEKALADDGESDLSHLSDEDLRGVLQAKRALMNVKKGVRK